jgi:hypothetical protein
MQKTISRYHLWFSRNRHEKGGRLKKNYLSVSKFNKTALLIIIYKILTRYIELFDDDHGLN